jgi:hypothetical protein
VEELEASLVQPPLSRQERHTSSIALEEHRPTHLGWIGIKCAGDRRLKEAVAQTYAKIARERANHKLPRRRRATVEQLNEEIVPALPARCADRCKDIRQSAQFRRSVHMCRLSRSGRLRERRALDLGAPFRLFKSRPGEWPLRLHKVFNGATEIAAFIQQLGE